MKSKRIFNYLVFSLLTASSVLINSCEKDDDNNNSQNKVPTLTTIEVSEITQTSAISGGDITDDGGAGVTARGVCWSTNQSPTISDNKTEDGSGLGEFTSNLTDLEPNTTYFARAYANNSVGTGYGNTVSFTTLEEETTVSDIDGNVYKTVIIGTQEWMAVNLKVTKYNDGASIPNITENSEWIELTNGAYCWYGNNETSYSNLYGALYNWYAVETGKLCPSGWHVPTDEEWATLVDFVGGENTAGLKLKATNGWDSNGNGTDDYEFSALPGGNRNHVNGSFSDKGINGSWWSATQDDPVYAWQRFMYYGNDKVSRSSFKKKFGFSVRCVKD